MATRRYRQPATPLDYRNQAAVPDHQRYSDNWRAMSESTRRRLVHWSDVPYGQGELQTCDIFPARNNNAPVFVFIHGGWWHFLDKSDYSYVAEPFVERGAACVCINYPLAPNAKIEEIVASVQAALLWVHHNIREYGGDPGRIAVGGHSAGGHLSAMSAFTDWSQLGGPQDLVKVNCAISGLYDLVPILETPHNENIRMDRATADGASPIDMIRPSAVKHILCVGAAETAGFLWQHETFVKLCKRRGLVVEDLRLAGEHHFSVVDQVANAESELFKSLWAAMTSG
ncbi:alpha/beta hydrolase [Variovorax sp. LjRoot84]